HLPRDLARAVSAETQPLCCMPALADVLFDDLIAPTDGVCHDLVDGLASSRGRGGRPTWPCGRAQRPRPQRREPPLRTIPLGLRTPHVVVALHLSSLSPAILIVSPF